MYPTNEVIDQLLDSIINFGDRVRATYGGGDVMSLMLWASCIRTCNEWSLYTVYLLTYVSKTMVYTDASVGT